MDEINDQRQQRIKKLDQLRQLGVQPYGTRFEVKDHAGELVKLHGDKSKEVLEQEQISCTIAGRVVGLRRFGKAAFAVLQDGSDRLQVYLKKDTLGEQAHHISEGLDLGDWIGVTGVLFRTKTNEFTVEVKTLTFLSKALRPLPEKWHGLTDVETRYRQRYVDLIANPQVHQIFALRSRIISGIRAFLIERGFLEVETPMMHPIPGGAAAKPFVTHHNALGTDLYLRIAPELYLKRLIVGGFPRVFEINRNFRNEGISTIHNPEFTMLEFYVSYADYQDLIRSNGSPRLPAGARHPWHDDHRLSGHADQPRLALALLVLSSSDSGGEPFASLCPQESRRGSGSRATLGRRSLSHRVLGQYSEQYL